MTIAEIYGKLTPYERMEDLLTSDVFGTFRYLNPAIGLVPFLKRAKSFLDDSKPSFLNNVAGAEYIFWPHTTQLNREPDVLILLSCSDGTNVSLVVEAKYLSGKSNILREDTSSMAEKSGIFDTEKIVHLEGDQLAELYHELIKGNIYLDFSRSANAKFECSVNHRYLFYVTANYAKPREEIEETISILEKYGYGRDDFKNLYWINWQTSIPVMEDVLNESSFADYPGTKNLIEDLLSLLRRKGLHDFQGYKHIKPITEPETVSFWTEALPFFRDIDIRGLSLNEPCYFWKEGD